jgi:hypothetical protein
MRLDQSRRVGRVANLTGRSIQPMAYGLLLSAVVGSAALPLTGSGGPDYLPRGS